MRSTAQAKRQIFIMGKRLSRSCVPLGIALAVAWRIVVTGGFRTSGESYLPKVGAPPLRYQALHAANPSDLPPLPSEDGKSADENGVPATPTVLAPFRSSAVAGAPADPSQPPGLWLSHLASANSLDLPRSPDSIQVTNPVATLATASDLLGVSPEMLIDYFKPALSTVAPTNAAALTVVVPIQFTPATPPASASTATYQTP